MNNRVKPYLYAMSVCKEEKFKSIFLEYNPELQRFLQSRGVERNQASDIVQDVFANLWQNCAQVIESTVRSFLYTMANNRRIDNIRKANIRLRYSSMNINSNQIETPHEELEVKEFKEKIEKALTSMSESSRVVFYMSRMEGKKYKEIADLLSISVKAVEKRMSKAILHLTNEGILRRKK